MIIIFAAQGADRTAVRVCAGHRGDDDDRKRERWRKFTVAVVFEDNQGQSRALRASLKCTTSKQKESAFRRIEGADLMSKERETVVVMVFVVAGSAFQRMASTR
jgi:hypothetical protein